ncbi:phage major tail protein, TP901-1 family [Kordiimonas sediminis]|uniref:Phage major tail protein, TP901-1 family n=1 Tax=Kordiimonas sediminis TaxID=1735581 RepID=A0A919E496_9PROT|nr:phage major tail protein, TP901-1 family [Kordiimonas sediminis]GHF18207.1 phage major tail protein, TP901-1 family [Kordiimonas sediminis]
MSAQAGKDMILKMDIAGTKTIIGGFRSNSFRLNGETVEVTNKGSGGMREFLEGGGVKSLSTSGSGLFVTDDHMVAVQTALLTGSLVDFDILIPGHGTFSAHFAVTNLEMSGEHNGEVTFSVSLESSGPIAFAV